MGLSLSGGMALLCAALMAQLPVAAPAKGADTLQIVDAWSRPTPPGIGVAAVYLSIRNGAATADRLLGASSPIAAAIEFHESLKSSGILSMHAVPFIECPAGATVRISPGGLHIMLTGLKQPLAVGSSFPLALHFRDAGRVSLTIAVQARD